MHRFAEAIVIFLLLIVAGLRDLFRRRPNPMGALVISGLAPCEGGKTRFLSGAQLEQLDTWFRLHDKGWKRITRPLSASYMVQMEHSDGSTTFVFLYARLRSAIYFERYGVGRRFDAGLLFQPVTEVESLIAMLSG